jgi:hypothetical protein
VMLSPNRMLGFGPSRRLDVRELSTLQESL